jgi:hypothetical protein
MLISYDFFNLFTIKLTQFRRVMNSFVKKYNYRIVAFKHDNQTK